MQPAKNIRAITDFLLSPFGYIGRIKRAVGAQSSFFFSCLNSDIHNTKGNWRAIDMTEHVYRISREAFGLSMKNVRELNKGFYQG